MHRFSKVVAIVVSLTLLACSVLGSFSVYAESAEEIYELVKSTPPTISPEGNTLVLPSIADCGYELKLYGSSNETVIDMDGNVHTPLTDMDVTVMYQMVNVADETDVIKDNWTEVSVTVPGLYTADEGDNAKPNVVPGLREWKGHTGDFLLTDSSRIVVEDATLAETGEQIAYYFLEMLGREIDVVVGAPAAGDIYLAWTDAAYLGEEGYTVEIADIVTVNAYAATGALYAGTSLTQILYQDEAHAAIPKGLIRDYPQYEVRGFGFDVARCYYPLSYIEEMSKYMAYYKLNEVHIHINDDYGEQSYAFRLESKLYPEINSSLNPAEVWSQEDYRAYQKEVAKFGIDVVTEIDSPAHAGFVYLHNPDYMLDSNSTWIDLENQDAKNFFKAVIAEFISGDDPVIQGDKFNIGTDEYDKNQGELVLQWTNELIAYVKELMGEETDIRMWAALGENGFQGETVVSKDVTVGHWSSSWADPVYMIDEGYRFINNYDRILYVVPGVQTGYQNYLDIPTAYNNWEVNICEITIPEANPLLRGAEAFVWHGNKVGASEFDVFDRVKDWTALLAQKCWCGSEKDGKTVNDFIESAEQLGTCAPGANPARYVESTGETVAEYDFESVSSNTVTDNSSNGYDGTVTDLSVVECNGSNVLKLDGDGHLSLPFTSIGFPYTVSFDLYIDPTNPSDAVLFSGDEGALYLNFEGSGKIAYQRKGYTYVFDAVLETGKWQRITLSCDNQYLSLAIDGEFICTGEYLYDKPQTDESWGDYLLSAKYFDSSTFILPVNAIGGSVVGEMDNLTVKNTCEFSVGNMPKWLEYTAEDLLLVGDGTGWWRWTDTGEVPSVALYYGMVTGGGHYNAAGVDSIMIRSFTVPESGTLTIRTAGGNWDISSGNDTTHDRYPTLFAITNDEGKIVYPANGNFGSTSYSMPVTLPSDDTLSFDVSEGDVYSFIIKDNSEVAMPVTFKAAVSLNGTRYDSNGLLQGANYNEQGENGWRYQYAESVTVKDTAPEEAIVPNMLVFDAIPMELIGATSWQRFGDKATDYSVYTTTTGYYNNGKPGYAHINRFVIPSDGTLKIDTAYTTGITMGNSASHDNYPVNYAIVDTYGKIVFPTDGQLGTVTYSNPVTIPQDQPLALEVKAGDEYSFIMIDNYGLQIPMNFRARVFVNDTEYDSSGYPRSDAFSAQGQNGWYYEYAASVEETPYVEPIIPITSISHNMLQWDVYAPDRMMDENESSFAWFQAQKAGQYIQFSFNTTRILNSISVLTAASGDMLVPSLFQVSMTGEEDDWVTVAELESIQRQCVEFTPIKANYARIFLTQDKSSWLKLYEVVIGEIDSFYGDINGDEQTDVLDVVGLVRAVYAAEKPSDIALYDINSDEMLDEQDVIALRRYILGYGIESM